MTPYRPAFLAFSAALCLGLAATWPARAGDDHDHDRARQALAAGEILPLQAILDRVGREGQIMEVELERHDGRWIYEIKLLRGDGSLAKLKLDARNGKPLGSEERKSPQTRRPGGNP